MTTRNTVDGVVTAALATLRILHIVESFGGGTASAVEEYVKSTPNLSHTLLYGSRPDSAHGQEAMRLFEAAAPLGTGLTAILRIRAAVRRLGVDLVHAHSSYAGLYARHAVRARDTPIAYTPHCFAFERRDLRPSVRAGVRIAEAVLARNTSVFAACSDREAALARQLHKRAVVRVVPNVAESRIRAVHSPGQPERLVPIVATNGRIGAQKDPQFFLDTFRRLRQLAPEVRGMWVGGGDAAEEQRLRDGGVEVTGWVSREQAVAKLHQADLYLHTAAWEGFPMAILEARALGLPILARSIEAIEVADPLMGAPTPALLAEQAAAILSTGSIAKRNQAMWQERLSGNTRAAQRGALLAAYAEAISGATRSSR